MYVIYIYIYIYRERERERESSEFVLDEATRSGCARSSTWIGSRNRGLVVAMLHEAPGAGRGWG